MSAPFMQLNVYGPGNRQRVSNLRSNQIRQFSSIISDILDHNRGRHMRVTVRKATYTSPCGTQVVRNEVVALVEFEGGAS